MARWQYQGLAEPISTSVETVQFDKWVPVYPTNVSRQVGLIGAITAGSCFFVYNPAAAVETVTIDKWLGSYPVRLDKVRSIINFNWIVVDPFQLTKLESTTLDRWNPTYPNRLDNLKRIQPLVGTIDPYFGHVPGFELITLDKWIPSYPVRLDRPKAVWPVGWISTDANSLITNETVLLDKWIPIYPNRLDRLKRIFWDNWSTIDANFSVAPINPVTPLELYFRRYLQDV